MQVVHGLESHSGRTKLESTIPKPLQESTEILHPGYGNYLSGQGILGVGRNFGLQISSDSI